MESASHDEKCKSFDIVQVLLIYHVCTMKIYWMWRETDFLPLALYVYENNFSENSLDCTEAIIINVIDVPLCCPPCRERKCEKFLYPELICGKNISPFGHSTRNVSREWDLSFIARNKQSYWRFFFPFCVAREIWFSQRLSWDRFYLSFAYNIGRYETLRDKVYVLYDSIFNSFFFCIAKSLSCEIIFFLLLNMEITILYGYFTDFLFFR